MNDNLKIHGIGLLNFSNWKLWFNSRLFSLKWFVLLVLFKPIIDAFYFVKDAGVFSPSQILGLFSFVLMLFFILLKKHTSKVNFSTLFFFGFSILIFFNSFIVYFLAFDFKSIGEFIRICYPIILFYYLRNEIQDIDDINGIITTFFISSIFPFAVYFYEYFFTPIQIIEISEGRGGGIRLTGIYADIFNYMSYFIGSFLIILIVTLNQFYTQTSAYIKLFILVLFISVVGLIGIKHQASWGVFFSLTIIYMLFSFNYQKGRQFISMILLISISFLPVLYNDYIAPLYAKEIRVINDENKKEKALNGRIVRWKKYFSYWENMSIESKLLGVGFSKHHAKKNMMSGGMHSDYVRFLFSSGILGLLFYLLFFTFILIRSFLYPIPIRFFTISSVMIFILYAISSNPFGASGALMFIAILGLILVEKPISFYVQ